MAFSQSNFNKFNRGRSLKSEDLNKIAASASASSVNTPTGGGLDASSSSIGTFYNLGENVARPPIWAQIISIQRVLSASATSGSGSSMSGVGTSSSCPNYIYSYGWVELVEDVNVNRQGQEFFHIAPIQTISGSGSTSGSSVNNSIINSSDSKDQVVLQCRDINQLGVNVGGMTGSTESLPAYEVNNQVTSLGTVVKLYFGHGNYMLFNNTGSSSGGTSSNFIDVITNVCPIFEEVEPAIGVTLINTSNGIQGGPITSSGTIQLSASGVKTGTYTNPTIVIDTYGRITQATNGITIEARIASLESRVTALGG